jgi:hypothetical protein
MKIPNANDASENLLNEFEIYSKDEVRGLMTLTIL